MSNKTNDEQIWKNRVAKKMRKDKERRQKSNIKSKIRQGKYEFD